MILERVFHDGLAQASYLVGCERTGNALVIDPNRNVGQYIALAKRKGLRISAVTETHIHADYVSGALELARHADADLYVSDEGPTEWKYAFVDQVTVHPVRDGETFHIGTLRMQVMHTPGHTPEHISFLLTDTTVADEPLGLFTGDFLFVGDVGRPDLLERAAGYTGTMVESARQLFHSLQRVGTLPDYLQVWPGHGAGSACGRALSAVPHSTLGYERRFNWAFQHEDEEVFAREILEGQPDVPPYFARMKKVNREGAAPRLSGTLKHATLESLLQKDPQGPKIVDIRRPSEYARGHLPGTLNLPLGADFLPWAGWLLPYDRDLLLVGTEAQAHTARNELSLIGFDRISGYVEPALLKTLHPRGQILASYHRMCTDEFAVMVKDDNALLLDVRTEREYQEGHMYGSLNIPLSRLQEQHRHLPTGRVLIYCQGGGRSPIAASILNAVEGNKVIEFREGFSAWQKDGLPFTTESHRKTTATSTTSNYQRSE